MVDAGREISCQDGHGAGFPAPASNDGPKLLDRLQGLAVAVREAFEYGSLGVSQLLADDRDQKDAPSLPAIAREQRPEIAGICERLAHGDELPQSHGSPFGAC